MLSFKRRLIQAVLAFLNGASIAVKPVNYACVRIRATAQPTVKCGDADFQLLRGKKSVNEMQELNQ